MIFAELLQRVRYISPPMAWNKADLRPRVLKRAAELGKTETDVMPKGYSIFAESKSGSSPRIDTLETLAKNLEWTLCELLFEGAVQLEVVKLAVTVASRAVRSDRLEVLPDATLQAIDILQGYERDQVPVDESALKHIERNLRALYKGR